MSTFIPNGSVPKENLLQTFLDNIKEGDLLSLQREKIEKFENGIYSPEHTWDIMPSLGDILVPWSLYKKFKINRDFWYEEDFIMFFKEEKYCPLKVGKFDGDEEDLHYTRWDSGSYAIHKIRMDGKFKLLSNNILALN